VKGDRWKDGRDGRKKLLGGGGSGGDGRLRDTAGAKLGGVSMQSSFTKI
jgi:hypothetical protein